MRLTIEKPSVALITAHGWVSISTSVLNTAVFWANKGYNVDIFISEEEGGVEMSLPESGNTCIRVIPSRESIYRNKIFAKSPYQFEVPYLFRHLEFFARNALPPRKYALLIGFDFKGVFRAMLCGRLWSVPFVYHSLELEVSRWSVNWERRCAGKARWIFIQDDARMLYMKQRLGLSDAKFRIVRNSPIGDIIREKKNYFREHFQISDSHRIVLVCGTMIPEHSVDRIAAGVSRWPERFVLVLHGWFPDRQYRDTVSSMREESAGRIFISERFFKASEKYTIFQSADYGIVTFEPVNENLRLAAGSAGKLFDYMRAGLPILGYDLPGMKDLLGGNGCGRTFTDFNLIGGLLAEMDLQYDRYAAQSHKAFGRYEFSSIYNTVYEELKPAMSC